jgi:hypothetical protein
MLQAHTHNQHRNPLLVTEGIHEKLQGRENYVAGKVQFAKILMAEILSRLSDT